MKGKTVALSAISSALSVIFLTIGNYITVLDLSCIFLASLVIILPLYKKSIKGAIFSFISTLILTSFLTGFKFNIIIPYGAFFGLHPIFNELEINKKINKYIALIIKIIWFVASLYLIYFTTNMFLGINEKFLKYIYYLIPIFGTIFIIFYDFCLKIFRKRIENIFKNIGI